MKSGKQPLECPIPQIDLLAGYQEDSALINEAVHRVLESGWYVLGTEVDSFETAFAAFTEMPHAIGVASGTDALELALRACGIGSGDQVLTVSHTAVATAVAIERCGAEVVFVDVEDDLFTMSPARLESTLKTLTGNSGSKPAAVVPVHLYGQMADMVAICEIARNYGLAIVEDCAQAHGARLNDRPASSWGDAAAFSFYPTKNLGGCGDGGIVVTADAELAARVRSLRQYGWRQQRYVSDETGVNSRLDELQAAILKVKLASLDRNNERRRKIASQYFERLGDREIRLPALRPGASHVYHQYVVRCDDRDGLRQHLNAAGIGTGIHYPCPVHRQPAWQNRCRGGDRLTVTDSLCTNILSLPMYPQLGTGQVDLVCNAIKSWSGS